MQNCALLEKHELQTVRDANFNAPDSLMLGYLSDPSVGSGECCESNGSAGAEQIPISAVPSFSSREDMTPDATTILDTTSADQPLCFFPRVHFLELPVVYLAPKSRQARTWLQKQAQ
jgi:hypothetical protein